jgi:hypothetical protein
MQTSVKHLKQDDLVEHYHHVFRIQQDAKQVSTTQSGAPVYATTGMCIQGEGNGYMAIGHEWTFQGAESVTVYTVTQKQAA